MFHLIHKPQQIFVGVYVSYTKDNLRQEKVNYSGWIVGVGFLRLNGDPNIFLGFLLGMCQVII